MKGRETCRYTNEGNEAVTLEIKSIGLKTVVTFGLKVGEATGERREGTTFRAKKIPGQRMAGEENSNGTNCSDDQNLYRTEATMLWLWMPEAERPSAEVSSPVKPRYSYPKSPAMLAAKS